MKHVRILLLAVLAGCGGKSSSGGAPPAPTLPSAVLTTPSGTQAGDVLFTYQLSDPQSDPCTVSAEYSVNAGASWAAATMGPGGDGAGPLASSPSPGSSHGFSWSSQLDAVGLAGPAPVLFRLTPADPATGAAGTSGSFTVDNSGNSAPAASVTTPTGAQQGLVVLDYDLTDAESNTCAVTVEVSTDGATWLAATEGPGSDGLVGLAASPGGTAHRFCWNSFADGVGSAGPVAGVQLRVTPTDGAAGTPAATSAFTVDNSSSSSGGAASAAWPVTSDPSTGFDRVSRLATDGRYLYAGGSVFESADSSLRIEKRRAADGALVSGFGAGGAVDFNPGAGEDRLEDLLLDGDSLYLAAMVESPAGTGTRTWLVEKRSAITGALDATFGTGGQLTPPVPPLDVVRLRLAIDALHLYVAWPEGVLLPDDIATRIQKRLKSDGSLVPSFGTNGTVEQNLDALGDGPVALTVDGGSLYVGAAQGYGGDMTTRIEKRSAATGALSASFGSAGVVSGNFSATGLELVGRTAVVGGDLFVLRLQDVAGQYQWVIERRLASDGSLVQSQSLPVNDNGDPEGGLVVAGGSVYTATTSVLTGEDTWRIERRDAATLALDGTFGTGGIVVVDPGVGGGDYAVDAVLAAGVLFVGGSDGAPNGGRWRIEARLE